MLEKLSVSLRPRNPWEAIDLGIALIRQRWRPVYAAWLAVYVPVALVLALTLGVWATLVVWWMKPALERVILHVVAASVFGEVPGVAASLKALPGMMRHGLFSSLTFYRFDFARSFNLPVWQLEGQSGRAARARGRQLHKRTRGFGVWLTAAFSNFELLLMLSLIGVFDMLIPAASRQDFQLFALLRHGLSDLPEFLSLVYSAAYLLAVGLLEPFYVSCGFALYLNRRALLEGWDIEMQMRRLAEAKRPTIASALVPAALLLVLLGVTVMPPSDARAADSTPARIAKEIKTAPEFQEYVEKEYLDYTGEWKRNDQKNDRSPAPAWLQAVALFLAQFSRVIMWIVLACGLGVVAYYLARHLSVAGIGRARRALPPQAVFGMDVRPESLPGDVTAAALQLTRAGQVTEALALLYRGALATLIHRDGLEIASGDTESDCVGRAKLRVGPQAGSFFESLVKTWQRAAYGRLPVETPAVEQFCVDWAVHFSRQP
jgi:hypothetical protein